MSARWLLSLGLLLLAAPALALEVEGTVVQVRDGQAHVRLEKGVRVAVGVEVELVGPDGTARTAVVALSSKFIVLKLGQLTLVPGQRLKLVVQPLEEPAAGGGGGGAAEGPRAPVEIGREPPGPSTYRDQPIPEFEKVPYRGRKPGPPVPKVEEESGAYPPPETPMREGRERAVARRRSSRLESNLVRGELELGVDAVIDTQAELFDSDDNVGRDGIERYTPFARLRLQILRLGGSDRARFTFYGSVRQDLDGSEDWTGRNDDQIYARFSHAELAIDSLPESQVEGFTDRIELGIGRMTIPDVVQAFVVDGVRLGVRAGPFVFFGFGGFGASPNPQREDYDSPIYGGGIRFGTAFAHDGAIHISVSGAQEQFRGDIEREFVEASLDARKGSFGLRGSIVVDFYDALRDERETDITTGIVTVYWQVVPAFRIDLGYRQVKPVYQLDLVGEDRVPPTGRGSDINPLLVPNILQSATRRTGWGSLSFDLPADFDLWFRGEVYQEDGDARGDAYGGAVGLAKSNLFTTDRLSVEVAVRRRERRYGQDQSTDPFVSLSYAYLGTSLNLGATVYYRASIPDEGGDSRIGGRLTGDLEIYEGFGLRGYFGAESYDDDRDEGAVMFGGVSVRYRF